MDAGVRKAHRSSRFLVLLLVLVGGFTGDAAAQGPLQRFKNYYVTGDYVVGGWTKNLSTVKTESDGTSRVEGTINIPDNLEAGGNVATSVPVGADIVAAFLYWETVESSQTTELGKNGFFNGVAITGTVLGDLNSPASWSSGGCAGGNNGSKTIRAYRADVRPYLNLINGNGIGFAPGTFQYRVRLADTGGNQPPFTLGATLVIVYRVLSPTVPLNAIAIFEGSYNPTTSSQTMQQSIDGFYSDEAAAPIAKLTHIVGNGQANKLQSVYLNNSQLLPIPASQATPFWGAYNNSWDNPTWNVSGAFITADPQVTKVIPNSSNAGCVTWGAVILSSPVQDTDKDGLLDTWESGGGGYTDVATQKFVPLPGADPKIPDIFVEVDYLSNMDGGAGSYLHSHLPKQAALDKVGAAFAAKGINIHFDVGNLYQTPMVGGPSVPSPCVVGQPCHDPYIITGGTGGNAIPESVATCMGTSCPFPTTSTVGPAVGWKEGFFILKDSAGINTTPITPLGAFAPERAASYHYVLFAHALGEARTEWDASSTSNTVPQLVSIAVNSPTSATVTLQTPPGYLRPGDCPPNAPCDPNSDRVQITGAIFQPLLNGVFQTGPVSTSGPDQNGLYTSTFQITTPTLPSPPPQYDATNEPQLAVLYGGPTKSSGHSDVAGGDTIITFGLWPADDAANCNHDPSAGPPYCDNQVGSVQSQAGTLMHELGHTLGLTHGGTYYNSALNNPSSLPTYGLNCKSNFLSVMNYLFQIRGFPDGAGIDYSGQTLTPLDEMALNEKNGLLTLGPPAGHLTRWYAPASAFDVSLGAGRLATAHCDGTPLGLNEPALVRVDGTDYQTSPNPNPVDWNNDLVIQQSVPPQDVNFNGVTGDGPNLGFNDWQPVTIQAGTNVSPGIYSIGINLQQVDARQNSAGLSNAAGSSGGLISGGGSSGGLISGGGSSGGLISGGGSSGGLISGGGSSGGLISGGGVSEVDFDQANSTVDAPTGLTGVWNKATHAVDLSWNKPVFGQIRAYLVYRLFGTFNATTNPLTNAVLVKTITGPDANSPPQVNYAPQVTFSDTSAIPNKTYTYWVVTETQQGNSLGKSGISNTKVITTK